MLRFERKNYLLDIFGQKTTHMWIKKDIFARNMKKDIETLLIKSHKYRDPDYSATRLAEDLGVENYKLSRILKAEYGSSYSDIVLSLRVADAKRHLVNPNKADMTVDEIGVLVGFKNRVSFFLAFRKFTGETPEEYRKGKTPSQPTKR